MIMFVNNCNAYGIRPIKGANVEKQTVDVDVCPGELVESTYPVKV